MAKGSHKRIPILELFVISLISLYFELLIIRWLSSEIRIFAYFKNVPLMACLFGLGLGMALSKNKRDFTKWFPVALLIITAILCFAVPLKLTHVIFLNPFEAYLIGNFLNGAQNTVWSHITLFLSGLAVLVGIFYLIVFTFTCLGQKIGQLFTELKPLQAYSINIIASILGIVLFSTASFLSSPPPIWLLIGILLSLYSFRKPFQLISFACTLLLAFTISISSTGVEWSPYYRINIVKNVIPKDGSHPEFEYGYNVCVNYDGIEGAYNNDPLALSKLSEKQHKYILDYYDIPYVALGDKPRSILVLAAGTGNDVAACLRHGATEVDAVEIDPTIAKIGRRLHPEQPYSDPRVHVIVNDARAYLRNSTKKYDLIVFSFLDSHAAFSSMSSLRLDNYVYTKESFADAYKLLKPNGVISVTFYYLTWWQLAHVYKSLEEGTNKEPIGIYSPMGNGPNLLVGANLNQSSLNHCRLKPFLLETFMQEHPALKLTKNQWDQIVPTTDDWPFLFLRDRSCSLDYCIGILVTLCIGLYLIRFTFKNMTAEPSAGAMFFLGAAFMLIETKSVTQMGLLISTTWLVNSVVITAILMLILLANLVQIRYKFANVNILFALLFVSLSLSYLLPISALNNLDSVGRYVLGAFLLSMPLFFAAMIFAIIFSKVERADSALGMNLFGALIGGALEYLSMVFGLHALNLIAIFLYFLAFCCLKGLALPRPVLKFIQSKD